MSDYWKNQIVLVTGATGGIGYETVKKFCSLGARVAGCYLKNSAKSKEMEAEFSNTQFKSYQVDIKNSHDVQKIIHEIETQFGAVSILINNAGIIQDSLTTLITDEQWYDMINTHLSGAFFCSRAVLKGMIQRKFGRILSISSISAIRGTKGQAHYAAAKAGQIALMKSLSREVGKKNIICNSLALGLIATETVNGIISDSHFQGVIESSSLRRLATAKEVAEFISILTGENSTITTGQTFIADCGFI